VTTSPNDGATASVQRLLQAGERLRTSVRESILAHGSAAVPALIAIVEDDDLGFEESPGGGWAPTHAADLLRELQATDAIEPMLRTLAQTDAEEYLHSALARSLSSLGASVVEPALRAHADNTHPDTRHAIASILARLGVRDDRILPLLLEELQVDPVINAGALADYGDPQALPALLRAFDDQVIDEEPSLLANQALAEIAEAIEILGGELSTAQVEKLDRGMAVAEVWRAAYRAETPPSPAVRVVRPGRNDACWCGSGTKYKKCHLRSDEDGSTAPPAQA
jgi:hypothetical protein